MPNGPIEQIQDPPPPTQLDGLSAVRDLDAGYATVCIADSVGRLLCCATTDAWKETYTIDLVELPDQPSEMTAVAVGWHHACALDVEGDVWCWGENRSGELGTGEVCAGDECAVSDLHLETPQAVVGLAEPAVAVDAGSRFTCIVTESGAVQCWGDSRDGQLGAFPEEHFQPVPLTVPGLSSVAVDIATGEFHACALLDDGTAQCWGQNNEGRLGAGFLDYSPAPTLVKE